MMKKSISVFLLSCVCLMPFAAKSNSDVNEYCTPDGDCSITDASEADMNKTTEERSYSDKFADQELIINKAMDLARDESGFSNCFLADNQTIQCVKDNQTILFSFKQIFNNKTEELEYYEDELDKEFDELEKNIEEE